MLPKTFDLEHKKRCWGLTASGNVHYHCVFIYRMKVNCDRRCHYAICHLFLSSIEEWISYGFGTTTLGRVKVDKNIYKCVFGWTVSLRTGILQHCVYSAGVTFKMLSLEVYVLWTLGCQRSIHVFISNLYETYCHTREHNIFSYCFT